MARARGISVVRYLEGLNELIVVSRRFGWTTAERSALRPPRSRTREEPENMAKDSGTELRKARDQNTWVAQERFLTRGSRAARHVGRDAYSLFVNKYQLGIHASCSFVSHKATSISNSLTVHVAASVYQPAGQF